MAMQGTLAGAGEQAAAAPGGWLATFRYVVALSWAMATGPILQTLGGMVDYAMVSPLGDVALGAVGLGNFIYILADTLIAGFAVGVQVQVANDFGSGRATCNLRVGCLLVVGVGLAMSVALYLASPSLFAAQAGSSQMAEGASAYLRVRLLGMPLFAFVLWCRGYWFGIQQPLGYVKILVATQLLNVVLNWLLIYGHLGFPRMGTTGAGLGTSISYAFAAVWCLARVRRDLLVSQWQRIPETTRRILAVAVPALVSGALGLPGLGPVWLAILGWIGDSAVAAGSVLMQVSLLLSLPSLGSALAAASLVGAALGRGSVAEARTWMQRIGAVLVVTMSAVGLALALAAGPLMGVFLDDPGARAEATIAVRVLGLTAGPQSLGIVFLSGLLATPYAARAASTTVLFVWILALPASAWLVSSGAIGLLGVFLLLFSAFAAQTLVLGAWWLGSGWARRLEADPQSVAIAG